MSTVTKKMATTSTVLQGIFIIAALTILTVSRFPLLSSRFVSYGSRTTNEQPSSSKDRASKNLPQSTHKEEAPLTRRILDWLAALQVPHGFFMHFYVASVLSSTFWLSQILSSGSVVRRLCLENDVLGSNFSMTFDQIMLTWALMAVQGARRLAESMLLSKSSSSKMWFVHWLLGLFFYIAVGIAVWIEGSIELLAIENPISRLRISYPSFKTMVGIPLFIMASGVQHDCHSYLASLQKYSLPKHPIFVTFVCPHYVAECIIYLALAVVSAPSGLWLNRTVFTAFIFVAVNLSVTASDTKDWYERRFGKDKVAHRWIMLPGIW